MKYLLSSLLSLLIILNVTYGQDVNSAPVDWSKRVVTGPKVALDGTFSISLPEEFTWSELLFTKGPTGSPFGLWEATCDSPNERAILAVIDIDIMKLPEDERQNFLPQFLKSFRRTGIEAMKKKGYELNIFEAFGDATLGPFGVRSESKFTKGLDVQYNFSRAYFDNRIYIIGYEGASDKEPQWYIESLKKFIKK